ncbi:hypothetical protein G7Y89_g8628 [Cudoniella acicularis]|uniref:Uncharacterized protein n=1 Tax=Cudoniella acicularis TaxID=354080 RepID=A0A8H4W0X0_9HELO|nr:hypothetical protein G7Y89_g8628 [Cudoniella acicularis]
MPKHNHSEDKILNSPLTLPELEPTRSRPRSNGLPSPDSYIAATHDTEYLQLRENIRLLRKAPAGADAKKVDQAWEVYKKYREECLQLCKSVLHKAQSNGRSASIESHIDPLDTRSSFSGSLTESSLPFHVNEQWLASIQEYKSIQEQMIENLRACLLATYRKNEPEASDRQVTLFLDDFVLRKNLILKWRDASVHAMKSEKLLFWDHFRIRSKNFETLKLDLQAVGNLFDVADSGEAPDMAIRECVISKNGDTILEFANKGLAIHPVLRFRVSSHLLAESSPLFAQMLLPKPIGSVPVDMVGQLPPPPSRITCRDGMEVKVYRMPQMELNNNDALTILLHAAHMHNAKVPRQIDFPVFVSVAEVCLRYRCTSPLELQVEYQWLPQWQHMIGDDSPDGMLLISFAFGLRRIFTRMSKTAILNSLDDTEIQSKHIWPQAVRDKIQAIRAAKIAQIHECCTNAIEEMANARIQRTASASQHHEQGRLPPFTSIAEASLKDLVDCLRLMPSAPQVHNGVCDYAPAFRSAINDIYNSISGLTLRDITGREGWALSKHAGPTENRYDDNPRDLTELEAPHQTRKAAAMSNEDINFRILSYVDDLKDLTAAAMIDKTFYRAYKRHEASLLKNVFRAERRRTLSQVGPDISSFRETTKPSIAGPSRPNGANPPAKDNSKYLRVERPKITAPPRIDTSGGNDDLYDVSPPFTPLSHGDMPMSAEEAHRILWPDDDSFEETNQSPRERHPPRGSEKFLIGEVSNFSFGQKTIPRKGDVKHIEDKARMTEDDKNKHLRDEKDMALGLGAYKQSASPS